MSDRSRVPNKISLFNSFIINTADRLAAINPDTTNPYWMDFNLAAGENTLWQAKKAAWLLLYASYTNPATSTSIVKQQVENFMSDFSTFAQPLLNKIVASGLADETDEAIFNFVLHRSEPTSHTTPIPEDCIPAITLKGRGAIEVHCRSALDQSRPSIPTGSGANSIQYSFVIGDHGADNADPDGAMMRKEIVTKAHFEINFGAHAQAQWLAIYFRWYNTHNPGIAGAWSPMVEVAMG